MNIAIGYHLQSGPWGGGNQFAKSLVTALEIKGHTVNFDLRQIDLDLILLTETRGRSPSGSFDAGDILRYLNFKNPNAIVVHRINECDERKGTSSMNQLLKRANYTADHTVFIASWLKDLDLWEKARSHSVILNGGNAKIFKKKENITINRGGRVGLVTHHWGNDERKGADVYQFINDLLDSPEYRDQFEFTYIGNVPISCNLSNSTIKAPMHGEELANELRSHDIYVTGSINEPAGMHHIEAALCGLPIIYRKSGALPEYCDGFGLGFEQVNELQSVINQIRLNYGVFFEALERYPYTADRMCDEYLELFNELISQRANIIKKRRLWRSPWKVLRNQIAI